MTLNEFLEANKDILTNAILEEVHPDIIAAASGTWSKGRLANVSRTIRNLLKSGADTGLTDDKPKKGSSRAVFIPKEHADVKIDGHQVKIPHVLKVAFHGTLDSHTTDGYGLLGESQNEHEVGVSNHFSMLRPIGQGEYETNHEGFLPPLLDHGENHEWMSVGKVSKIGAGDFRNLTKTEDFPKGISHNEFYHSLNHHWYQSNGASYWGGSHTKERLDKLGDHPLVDRAFRFCLDTDTRPEDFYKGNMGIWEHPVTGEKHIVTSDAGFSKHVARRYQDARKNQSRGRY